MSNGRTAQVRVQDHAGGVDHRSEGQSRRVAYVTLDGDGQSGYGEVDLRLGKVAVEDAVPKSL